jgi:hypothetical protein
MSKKLIALAVSTALLCAMCATPAAAGPAEDEQARLAAKVKSAVAKLGTGPDARIEVKLRDKTKLKGYIREANAENFVLVDDKTGASTQITYPQVKQAKGRNRLSGDKILAVAIIGFIMAAYFIGYARCGKNC